MMAGRRAILMPLIGVLALLAGLVAAVPARLGLPFLEKHGVIAWAVEGTLWDGRAAGIIVKGHDFGSLSWDAQAANLLRRRLGWRLSLRTRDGFIEGRVSASLLSNRQWIRDLEAAIELSSLPPVMVPPGVRGQARVSLRTVELDTGWPTVIVGRAAVTQLELPGVIIPLGPFEFRFDDRDGAPLGAITSLGGPLAVDGEFELPSPGQWRLKLELWPGENPPRELVDGLRFIGDDLGNGRRLLELQSET